MGCFAPHRLLTAALALIATISIPTFADSFASGNPECHALVVVSNDLFLVSAGGSPVTRFTRDGLAKQLIALSPDEAKVAFAADPSPNLMVADATGRRSEFTLATNADGGARNRAPDLYASAPLIGIRWSSDSVIRLRRHVSPTTDRFEFFFLSNKPEASLERLVAPSYGVNCSLSSRTKRVACVVGPDVVVDNVTAITTTELRNSSEFASVNVPLGVSTSTGSSPLFQVQVKSLHRGITLRVTLPNGNWKETRVSNGAPLTVAVDGAVFDFIPRVVDASTGTTQVEVLKRNDHFSLDPGLAWSLTDNFLVVTRSRGSDSTDLLLLYRKAFERKLSIASDAALPITEPINELRFTPHSSLAFQTYGRFGNIAVRLVKHGLFGLGRPTLEVDQLTELPRSLKVDIGGGPQTAPVIDWSCK